MNQTRPPHPPASEADLQACVDRQLTPERQREMEAYLAQRPEEAQRADSYLAHKRELRALFDPVLDEPLPQRLRQAATPRSPWYLQRLAAGIAIAVVSGAAGWGLRGGVGAEPGPSLLAQRTPGAITVAAATGFAQRAAIAHAVYSPDQRRAVEVGADQEDQLVAWLSKRMGAPMKPPHLQALGYALEGGRLLPGSQGPVAQFMYHDNAGAKLTLYVSNEVADAGAGLQGRKNQETAFRFAQEGKVNVFYWVNGPFGYAISADADQAELARVSGEVYRQIGISR
ncbi:anti-sigma factor [Polaromonas sp.]|uniref:anti-sigma factor family protein n=1 Tax=Polaromonas sp. TaxID=1869339 RepID=UPI0017FEDC39|nr:anti-sigma factor [Polaromonas sp.]NMM05391.1 anti-sigma factor [Polaromonas sp.]